MSELRTPSKFTQSALGTEKSVRPNPCLPQLWHGFVAPQREKSHCDGLILKEKHFSYFLTPLFWRRFFRAGDLTDGRLKMSHRVKVARNGCSGVAMEHQDKTWSQKTCWNLNSAEGTETHRLWSAERAGRSHLML